MSKVESTVSSKVDAGSTAPMSVDGCCGGPPAQGTAGCCAQDAAIKAGGGEGCGCSTTVAPTTASTSAPLRSRCC